MKGHIEQLIMLRLASPFFDINNGLIDEEMKVLWTNKQEDQTFSRVEVTKHH
jgi:hypothetical protein